MEVEFVFGIGLFWSFKFFKKFYLFDWMGGGYVVIIGFVNLKVLFLNLYFFVWFWVFKCIIVWYEDVVVVCFV